MFNLPFLSREVLESSFRDAPCLPSTERNGDADVVREIAYDSLDRGLRSGERFDFLDNAALDSPISPPLLRIGEGSSVSLLLREVCETGEAEGLRPRAVLFFADSRADVLCTFSCSAERLSPLPLGSGEELYLFLLDPNFLSAFLDEPFSGEGDLDLLVLDLDTDLWDRFLEEVFFWTGDSDRDEDFLLKDWDLSLGDSNLFCVTLDDECCLRDGERDLFFPYNNGLGLRDLEAIEASEGDLL